MKNTCLIYGLLFIHLTLTVGCYEADHTVITDNNKSGRLEAFESKRIDFRFTVNEDISNIISMYEQNKQDTTFYFGGTITNNKILMYEVSESIKDNNSYLQSGDIDNQVTWSMFSKFNQKDHIKTGDFIGTIKAQIVNIRTLGLPQNFAELLKDKFFINMARFLTTSAQGQGFGTEACKAFVVHVFNNTVAEIIISISLAENFPSRKSVLACGFKEIGQFDRAGKKEYLLIKEKVE